MPVLKGEDLEQTRSFWVDFLGFEAAVDQPGFLMLVSPDVPTTQVILGDPSASEEAATMLRDVDVSIDVVDVDAAYADALDRGLDVVYPVTTEPWGPRRFFVRLPGGTVVNVVGHAAATG